MIQGFQMLNQNFKCVACTFFFRTPRIGHFLEPLSVTAAYILGFIANSFAHIDTEVLHILCKPWIDSLETVHKNHTSLKCLAIHSELALFLNL